MECYAWAIEPMVVVVGNISKGMTKRIFPFGSLWSQLHCVRGPLLLGGDASICKT